MSQYFLTILKEEVPDLNPAIERVLLKRRDQLDKGDISLLKATISPNVARWTRLLKRRYIRDGYPRDWADRLREMGERLDMLDIMVLDVVGRRAVYGDKPLSVAGYLSIAAKVLTWVAMAFAIWMFARHNNLMGGLGICAIFITATTSRYLAMVDVWIRYGK